MNRGKLVGRGIFARNIQQRLRAHRMGLGIIGIGCNRGVEIVQRLAVGVFAGIAVVQRPPLEIGIIGRHHTGARFQQSCRGGWDLSGHRLDHGQRDFALHGKDIAQLAVEMVGPFADPGLRIDQFGRNAQRIACAPHTAVQQPGHTELLSDRHRILFVITEMVRRCARGHLERPRFAQFGAHFFGQAIGKIRLIRFAAEIGERQHGNAAVGRARAQ